MLKSLGLHVTNPVVPQISGSKSLFDRRQPIQAPLKGSQKPSKSVGSQIRSARQSRMLGRLAKGFTRTGGFLHRALAKLHFQYISPLVCSSKAARKMWLGHFTLGNGAYRAQEEESNSVIRGNSRKTRNWFYFRTSLSWRRRRSSQVCLGKCESLESAFGEM